MTRPSRIGAIHLTLALFFVALVWKMATVQLLQRRTWTADAQRQQTAPRAVPAPRGDILDARGELLAQSRETVRLAVAPPAVRDRAALQRALRRGGVPPEWVHRATDGSRRWVAIPGHFLAADVAAATAMRGVYATPEVVRSYVVGSGTRRIVGRVDTEGRPLDGLELSLDSLLRGSPGRTTLLRDGRGRRVESPGADGRPATPGNTVVLTINQELQEIAERALEDAVQRMEAEGGDVVVLDPVEGEILALASVRADPRSTSATAFLEPYEPGSTIKPFIAAALLQRGRARETDVVPTFGGRWTVNGRTLTDEHPAAQFSLADVLRFSSNIGIVQFAQRLTAREQFETLRDFGFGSPTGVPYPVEAAGTLREPARWSAQSATSLAMGYEIAVTPLQLACAYVALANDGRLLEPALVKEVRAPDGRVLYRHTPRVVRRVLSPDVAQRVRRMLLGVVEEGGTARSADLVSFSLAGKTGTARRTVNGRYAAAQHIPTFVGLFPGDNPQFVILVKIDNPRGAYYGGLTAAPVTKAVLEAALASRDAALDRVTLAASRHDRPVDSLPEASAVLPSLPAREAATPAARAALQRARRGAENDSTGVTPFVAVLPVTGAVQALTLPTRVVPDVRGLTLRQAAHALHAAGFRVRLLPAPFGTTIPAAGATAAAGTVVALGAAP